MKIDHTFINENTTNYFGVPDSQLKQFCDYLYFTGIKQIVSANEGNAVALAAGHYLATGKIPCVYLQNSGLGNITNPVASLLNTKVYGIPCIFIIGWRGEPDIKDEPQHRFQGERTLDQLKLLDIEYLVVSKDITEDEFSEKFDKLKLNLEQGRSIALVIKKDSLEFDQKVEYKNNYKISRENFLKLILKHTTEDIVVSTTGKTSRELFEIRDQNGQSHKYDFLTVGSMGHSSSIALGIALNKPKTRVWCIDGDGACLMHMGAMAVIGSQSPKNMVHIVINNEAHESVGGQPTAAKDIDFKTIAKGCNYKKAYSTDSIDELEIILNDIKNHEGPIFIEIKASIGSRKDLGRPSTSPIENKEAFMKYLSECE